MSHDCNVDEYFTYFVFKWAFLCHFLLNKLVSGMAFFTALTCKDAHPWPADVVFQNAIKTMSAVDYATLGQLLINVSPQTKMNNPERFNPAVEICAAARSGLIYLMVVLFQPLDSRKHLAALGHFFSFDVRNQKRAVEGFVKANLLI